MLSENIKTSIKALPPVETETCGVVVNGEIIQIQNNHPSPEDNFRLNPGELAAIAFNDIQAIWHTHWKDSHSSELSTADIQAAHDQQLPIISYHTGFDEWDYYEPNSPNPYPLQAIAFEPTQTEFYLNWKWRWGRSDCFSLIRRFYLGKLGTEIGEFTRPSLNNFPQKGYQCPWGRDGFNILPPMTTPQLYDVFEIALKGGKHPNHIAVLVDPEGNQILHSPGKGHLSMLSIFGSYWRSRVVNHRRHQSLC